MIPDPSNPQAWNRYGYVYNNPINFNDPTGHARCNEEGDCWEGNHQTNGIHAEDYARPKRKILLDDEGVENNATVNVLEKIYYDLVELEASCTSEGFTNVIEDVGCLDYYSVLSQDLATISSFFGTAVTVASTMIGCLGGIEGCYAGYVEGKYVHKIIFNFVETGFSLISLVTTWQSDNLTGDNKSLLEPGEDTKTSFTTFGIGLMTSDPFIDFGVDFYSSGYNHEYFCGISTVLECFP